MIGTIRKHSKWLWGVVIFITISSFLYWGSSRYDNGRGGSDNFGMIDGERITREEVMDARGEIALRYFLKYGTWPDRDAQRTGFDEQRELPLYLFMVRKEKELNIHVDSDAVGLVARNILGNLENQSRAAADVVREQHTDDLERYVRHELGREQLFALVGLSGQLVMAPEANALFQREFQEIASEAVFFSASNYLAGVPLPTPSAIAEFYTNEMSVYRVPERVQVSYIAFDITNRLAKVERDYTNLNSDLEITLNRFGTNIARFGKTPEEARAKIRSEMIREKAVFEAHNQADAFAAELFDLNPVQAGNLATLGKKKGLKVAVTQPFDEQTGPKEFDGGPNFAKAAFALTAEEPFAGQSLIGDSAVYVIAVEKRLPSEIPPLSQIRDRVMADYKFRQAALKAHQAGEDFAQAAATGLAHGKTFAALCAEARVKPVSIPHFSLSTQELPLLDDYISLAQFKEIAFSLSPGNVSSFTPSHDGGVVVYLEQRVPVDTTKINAELPIFLGNLRRARQFEAVNAWAAMEEPKAMRNTVWNQQRQAGAAGGGTEP